MSTKTPPPSPRPDPAPVLSSEPDLTEHSVSSRRRLIPVIFAGLFAVVLTFGLVTSVNSESTIVTGPADAPPVSDATADADQSNAGPGTGVVPVQADQTAGIVPAVEPYIDNILVRGAGVAIGQSQVPGYLDILVPTDVPPDLIIEADAGCPSGDYTPSVVVYYGGRGYGAISNIGDHWSVPIGAADLTDGLLQIEILCNVAGGASKSLSIDIGHVHLFNPEGTVTDATSGAPIPGAQVHLYHVPSWVPGPGGAGAGECQNDGGPWGQPAPIELGVPVIPGADYPIYPYLNPIPTNEFGVFGWSLPNGCWYVEVAALGYHSTVSPVFGPNMTNLHLQLHPEGTAALDAVDDNFIAPQDSGPIPIDPLANDTYGVLVKLEAFSPINGTVDCDLTSCSFTPAPGFAGPAGFVYTLTDSDGATDHAVVFIDVVASSNLGPVAPDRFYSTNYGAAPSVIDGLKGVTDPEGDPIAITAAFIIDGVGTLQLDGTDLIYTPPPVKSDPREFAGIDVFYLDGRGATGVGHIFIDLGHGPVNGASCEVVELVADQLLVNRSGQTSSFIESPYLPCPYYHVEIISEDPEHGPGYQSEQTHESFSLRGVDNAGNPIYAPPAVPDLPEADRSATTTYGPVALYGVAGWELEHVQEGHGPNSVFATVRLIPASPPQPCEFDTIIEDHQLLNASGHNEVIVPIVSPCYSGQYGYALELIVSDPHHRAGYQTSQTEEQVIVEGLDAKGDVVFSTPVSPDLPDDATEWSDYYEVDLRGITQWRIRHAATGSGINSLNVTLNIVGLS